MSEQEPLTEEQIQKWRGEAFTHPNRPFAAALLQVLAERDQARRELANQKRYATEIEALTDQTVLKLAWKLGAAEGKLARVRALKPRLGTWLNEMTYRRMLPHVDVTAALEDEPGGE